MGSARARTEQRSGCWAASLSKAEQSKTTMIRIELVEDGYDRILYATSTRSRRDTPRHGLQWALAGGHVAILGVPEPAHG